MPVQTQQLESYLENFAQLEKQATSSDLPWLRSLRQEAFAHFCKVGFPTTREEDWRFTNAAPIAQTSFQLPHDGHTKLRVRELQPFRLSGLACQLVFVNGYFEPELSRLPSLPDGVTVTSLAHAIARNPSAVEQHLGRYADYRRDAFCALNTAFINDGAYLHIRRGTVAQQPIYLLYVSTASDTPTVCHPRNLIVADENSQATIVEDYISLAGGIGFSNVVTELVAGEQTVLAHYMIEREDKRAFNVSTLRMQQGRSASVASHSVLLGGALVRNNVHPVLAGEGGECLINGLFIGDGHQHMDNYMLVEHASPRCGSRQFYNGILDGASRGVFHGRIIVHKDAQKTDAKQTNRNLLLSNEAQVDTKPQLEIYADDVKCTHGATIGQVQEEALFYLRSRGLDQESARRLLIFAFAREFMERMKEGPIRTFVERLVGHWLPGGGAAKEGQ